MRKREELRGREWGNACKLRYNKYEGTSAKGMSLSKSIYGEIRKPTQTRPKKWQPVYNTGLIKLSLFSIATLYFECMTSLWRVWRHNWHVTVTKINIFVCFTHHISFIFIASILVETHSRALSAHPQAHERKKPGQNRVNNKKIASFYFKTI